MWDRFARRLRDERNQRTISFTLAELRAIRVKAEEAMQQASTGMVRNSLRHVTDLTTQALERSKASVPSLPPSDFTNSR
jgi:hypothetical protein